jgi:hypothetical protein
MAHWDVSGELRGPHGRWTKSGAAIHRMAEEAKQSRTEGESRQAASLEDIHKRVNDIANTPINSKGKGVNGILVQHTDKGIKVRLPGATKHYQDPREASVAVFRKQHHEEGHSPIPLPGERGPEPPRPPPRLPEPKPPPRPPRELEPSPGPKVVHPNSLVVKSSMGVENNKRMRQKVLKATTKQAEVTPDLVAKTDITITKTPHGRRKTGTLASHSGVGNTLHIKPEVLIGDNTQDVLERNRGSWWVPTDPEHDLSMNVMTHEFGHGVHGDLSRRGILAASRHHATTTGKPEQEFWSGLAGTINRGLYTNAVTDPNKYTTKDVYGRDAMDVGAWFSDNRAAIKKKIGTYAGTNMNEMLAELWTEYRLSSNPRPPAKYYGDYVMRRMNE